MYEKIEYKRGRQGSFSSMQHACLALHHFGTASTSGCRGGGKIGGRWLEACKLRRSRGEKEGGLVVTEASGTHSFFSLLCFRFSKVMIKLSRLISFYGMEMVL